MDSPHKDRLTTMPFVSTHITIGILNFVNILMNVTVLKDVNLQKQDSTATSQILDVGSKYPHVKSKAKKQLTAWDSGGKHG